MNAKLKKSAVGKHSGTNDHSIKCDEPSVLAIDIRKF